MNIGNSTQQFLSGQKNIEEAIVEKLRKSDINVVADNFLWHKGKNIIPIPTVITLDIKVNERTANAVFDREQLEDSWERIVRHDVVAIVNNIVAKLTL